MENGFGDWRRLVPLTPRAFLSLGGGSAVGSALCNVLDSAASLDVGPALGGVGSDPSAAPALAVQADRARRDTDRVTASNALSPEPVRSPVHDLVPARGDLGAQAEAAACAVPARVSAALGAHTAAAGLDPVRRRRGALDRRRQGDRQAARSVRYTQAHVQGQEARPPQARACARDQGAHGRHGQADSRLASGTFRSIAIADHQSKREAKLSAKPSLPF